MGSRIRPVQITIQVDAVIDDGESLTPAQVSPLRLSPSEFDQFELADLIGQLQAQLEAKRAQDPG